MTQIIFDIETDGLLDDVTKLHVLSYKELNSNVNSINNYDSIRSAFSDDLTTIVGHDIIRYDLPVLSKLLQLDQEELFRKTTVIDTLSLSWYLFPDRIKHGLEEWGEELGIKKPPIKDWSSLTYEEYKFRCEQDVLITEKLYNLCMDKLNILYEGVDKDINRIISYLSFKMRCAAKQQVGWKLDVDKCKAGIEELEKFCQEKVDELAAVMPPIKIYAKRKRPDKPYKKDGTLSVAGAKWFNLLERKKLNKDYLLEVEEVIGTKPPNPGSHDQVKEWLYSLGWQPQTFKFNRDSYGNERKIPQVRVDGDDGKELCPSVKKLVKREPAILSLEGLTVAEHRLAILRGFLERQVNGRVRAEIGGLTNTLRFKHKAPLVNLPGIHKPYGELVRGCLIADEGEVLCGSDMASLESMTKRHFMFPYDPDYVEEMSKPGFDEHLDLAKAAGKVTQEQIDDYNNGNKAIKPIRNQFKPVNYGCVYGLQAKRLAREQGWTVNQAQELIDIYWKRNWSVKKLSEDQTIKYVNGEMWLFNPVSKFWYSLRFEKDIFSTLNQGTGCYCFDKWVYHQSKVGWWPIAQFHDEVVHTFTDSKMNKVAAETTLRHAIQAANRELQLNVTLDISIQFGNNYAEIH